MATPLSEIALWNRPLDRGDNTWPGRKARATFFNQPIASPNNCTDIALIVFGKRLSNQFASSLNCIKSPAMPKSLIHTLLFKVLTILSCQVPPKSVF